MAEEALAGQVVAGQVVAGQVVAAVVPAADQGFNLKKGATYSVCGSFFVALLLLVLQNGIDYPIELFQVKRFCKVRFGPCMIRKQLNIAIC